MCVCIYILKELRKKELYWMYKLKTYAPYGLNERDIYEAFETFKIHHIFSIYNKMTRGYLICFCFCCCCCFFSFRSSSFFYSCLAISFFVNFICLLVIIYLSLAIMMNIINIIVILINITGRVILEKSSWGELQARNSSGMV